jgi:hypothetical protein
MITTALLWAAAVACALLAASGYAQMGRTKGGWREAAGWTAPLIFTSAATGLLALLGVLPLIAGAFLAVVPLAVVTARSARVWRQAAGTKMGKAGATRLVLSPLWQRVRGALWNAWQDARDLAGANRRAAGSVPAATPPGKGAIAPRLLEAVRSVPPLADGAPGGIPFPEEVAADLEAAGAVVPAEWQAVADLTADFEPQDQDELDEHMASEAAALLTLAEAAGARAETLLGVRKLHPRYAAALLEVADGYAELASLAGAAHRVYHDTYGDINGWHDAEGNELPEDGRGWFGGAA